MPRAKDLQIDAIALKKGELIFRAINNKTRQKILLTIHSKKAMTVSEIYKKLKIEQSVASLHLGILRNTGLVQQERNRRNIFYSVNYDRLKEVEGSAINLIRSVPVPPAKKRK